MKRQQFAILLAGCLIGLMLPGIARPAFPQPAPQRPNIVIIFADDLGYGDLGCYGHPTIRTPNLDRMAGEGMRFTQFYSAAPFCTPSRAALLTGRLPIRTGLTRVLFPISKGGIQDSEVTVAELLKSAGYSTACVGKWHLGHLPPYLPTRHGFDSYFGIPYSNDMSRAMHPRARFYAPPTPLIRDAAVIEIEPDQSQLTRRYTEEAIRFIQSSARANEPFFLYFPHTFPHWPLFASERFLGASSRGLYGDVVEELDWSVGEVLQTLREEGVERDTLVIFTSDNGPSLGLKLEGGSAGLLRGGKGSTWEGGVREPFIARWPGRIPEGVVTQAFGTMMDLLPTCVNLAGAKMPAGRTLDGEDLSPVLFENHPGREALLFSYRGEEAWAVRKGPWKLHVVTRATGGPVLRHDPPLLYNLLYDPSEKYDVAEAHPDVVKELLDLLEQHNENMRPGEAQR